MLKYILRKCYTCVRNVKKHLKKIVSSRNMKKFTVGLIKIIVQFVMKQKMNNTCQNLREKIILHSNK